MSDFSKQISGGLHSKYSNAMLYTLFIGMAAGNAIPAPSDAVYFYFQTRLRDRFKRGEITAKEYWAKNMIGYYLIPCTWWILLAFIVVNVQGSSEKKAKIALALIGSSAVLGVVLKAIQKDEKQIAKEDEERLLLLKNHPEIVEILQKPEFSNISGQLVFKNYDAINKAKLDQSKAIV